MSAIRTPGRTFWATALLIALLAALPYANAMQAGFVFDDVGVIRDNPVVQRDPPTAVFTAVYEPGFLYRPLTMLTYVANARLSPAPWGFHLANVGLHVLVALLARGLAWRLLDTQFAAAVAALLFAVHPVHTEAVTGVVGRAELLAALAAFGTLLALARALDAAGRGRVAWMGASILAFAAGLLAKESAFTIVGLVAVLHWRLAPRASFADRVRLLLPYAVVGAAYLGLRVVVVGALGLPAPPGSLDNVLAHVDLATRIRTALIVLWEYVSLLAFPLTLSADYSFNAVPLAVSNADPRLLLAVALLGGLALAVIAAARRAPALLVATLFTVIPLALTANLLVPIGTIKAERLLYLPSFGWCLACGWLLARLAAARPRTAVALVSMTVMLFGTRTWLRNRDWRDERTLYAATVATAPNSAKAHHNLAVALQRDGELEESMVHFRRALEIYPDYASAAFGIGHLYTLKGLDAGAVPWYQEALRRDPHFAKAHLQLGMIRQRHREYAAAEAAFRAGLESEPDNPLLLVNLAAVRLSQGDRGGAQAALRRLDRVTSDAAAVPAVVAEARRQIEVALP